MSHSATPWTVTHQASFTISQSLFKHLCIESVMPSNHLILCCPLLLSSAFPNIRVFSSESVLHIRWQKYLSFSFSISPSNVYSGLSSFRIHQLDLLQPKWLSTVFSSTTVWKHQFFGTHLLYDPTFTSIHDYWGGGEEHSFDYMTFVSFWFLHQIWMKSLLDRVFFHHFKYLMPLFPGLQSFCWKISW